MKAQQASNKGRGVCPRGVSVVRRGKKAMKESCVWMMQAE